MRAPVDVHNYRPHLLPKLRSDAVLKEAEFWPCTARISSIIPGYRCAASNTVVACHVGGPTKGIATKVSDGHMFFGCLHCHDLYDMRDKRWFWLMENHPEATMKRIVQAICETQTLLLISGAMVVPDGEFI